jgi:putative transcription factor
VEDYGSRVKRARESQEMSVGDLASRIKEKESVVRRIESGKLSPDQQLAGRFENALDITLYSAVSEVTAPQEQSAPGSETTIGDVAEVRERE